MRAVGRHTDALHTFIPTVTENMTTMVVVVLSFLFLFCFALFCCWIFVFGLYVVSVVLALSRQGEHGRKSKFVCSMRDEG